MTYIIWIAMPILIGLVCACIAKKRGKNPTTWFHAGTIISILVFLGIKEIKQIKEKKGRV